MELHEPREPREPREAVAYGRKWYVMAAVGMSIFLATLDLSIVNVALPTLIRDLRTDFPTVQWVILAYSLALATLLLSVGRLGDMLGNHQLGFAASLNGRINETLFLAQYVNLSRRLNWALGVAQEPYFYYEGSGYQNGPNTGEVSYVQSIRRLVVRDVEALGSYPFSRFRRLEFGAGVFNVQDARRL